MTDKDYKAPKVDPDIPGITSGDGLEPGGSQADMDRAVFEVNTKIAEHQLKQATRQRDFVEPEAKPDDAERQVKLNIELGTAKKQVDAGLTDDRGLFDTAK